jgi:hypothetical protein
MIGEYDKMLLIFDIGRDYIHIEEPEIDQVLQIANQLNAGSEEPNRMALIINDVGRTFSIRSIEADNLTLSYKLSKKTEMPPGR